MNFYELEKNHPNEKFDVIIFGSSFMLMPDQVKAIEIAKSNTSFSIIFLGTLNQKGKIYFLLTLYDGKNIVSSVMEILKPYLKYLTTVDFGKVTYKSQFEEFLATNNLKPTLQ
jgi:hypothetical protein